MNREKIQERTKAFALQVIRLVEGLPKDKTSDVIGRQLLRCGTSIGANYRAACRARSQADFIAKMGIVEGEADESIYWMNLLAESNSIDRNGVADLIEEANQLVAITVSSIKTAKQNRK